MILAIGSVLLARTWTHASSKSMRTPSLASIDAEAKCERTVSRTGATASGPPDPGRAQDRLIIA